MGEQGLKDLSFEDWIEHVFSHPAPTFQAAWYHDFNAEFWDGPPALTVAHVTRLFEDPDPPLTYFADSQIAQGLHYLIDCGASDSMLALTDPLAPLDDRVACVRSIGSLFAKLFAPRCTPHLSRLDEPGCGVLNGVCYMWWDIFAIAGQVGETTDQELQAINKAILAVMKDTLELESLACREGALHGLGHWYTAFPEDVTAIIDDFLRRTPDLRPELEAYARSARCGCVL